MNNKRKSIPKLKTDKEVANFFDSHDTTDFLTDTVNADLAFPNPTHKVVITLDEKEWQLLRRKASLTKIPYLRLLKKIIHRSLASK